MSTMPRLNNVPSLVDLVTITVSNVIVENLMNILEPLSTEESFDYKIFEEAVDRVVSLLRPPHILHNMYRIREVIYETARENICHFSVNPDHYEIASKILYKLNVYPGQTIIKFGNIIKDLEYNVTQLYAVTELMVRNVRGINSAKLSLLLDHSLIYMRQVRTLYLYKCATNAMMQVVGARCPLLKVLSVRSSENTTNIANCLTDHCIQDIIRCTDLELFILCGRAIISTYGYLTLLLNLPNLKHFSIGPLEMTKLLFLLAISPEFSRTQFGLKLFRCFGVPDLHVIPRFFPHLTVLDIDFCDVQNVHGVHDFMGLSRLVSLNILNISNITFTGCNIRNFFMHAGHRLSTLGLCQVHITLDDLALVGRYCTSLKNLRMKWCFYSNSDAYDTIPQEAFCNLRELRVECNMDTKHLQELLKNCKDIRSLHINNLFEDLTDDTFVSILNQNPMSHLEGLELYRCHHITIRSAYFMVEKCQNLDVLLGLDTCLQIDQVDLLRFKAIRCMRNLKLSLEEGSRYPSVFTFIDEFFLG